MFSIQLPTVDSKTNTCDTPVPGSSDRLQVEKHEPLGAGNDEFVLASGGERINVRVDENLAERRTVERPEAEARIVAAGRHHWPRPHVEYRHASRRAIPLQSVAEGISGELRGVEKTPAQASVPETEERGWAPPDRGDGEALDPILRDLERPTERRAGAQIPDRERAVHTERRYGLPPIEAGDPDALHSCNGQTASDDFRVRGDGWHELAAGCQLPDPDGAVVAAAHGYGRARTCAGVEPADIVAVPPPGPA